jgi:hypothetical protein
MAAAGKRGSPNGGYTFFSYTFIPTCYLATLSAWSQLCFFSFRCFYKCTIDFDVFFLLRMLISMMVLNNALHLRVLEFEHLPNINRWWEMRGLSLTWFEAYL